MRKALTVPALAGHNPKFKVNLSLKGICILQFSFFNLQFKAAPIKTLP
jgi:hypothetical protein